MPLIVGFVAWLVALAVMAALLRNWELADKPEESDAELGPEPA